VFAKLVVVILMCGVGGGSLLSMRQMRMQAAHEMAESRLRVRAHERELQRVRAEISARVTPDQVRAVIELLGDLETAVPEGCPPAPEPWWLTLDEPELLESVEDAEPAA
jgi:hypothetical protein